MNKPILVIMAAGLGSRYGGLKQMAPVDKNGHILIDYSIYDAYRAGFRRIVVVTKPELESDFRERIGDKISKFVDIQYAYQMPDNLPKGYSIPEGREKPWGTAHAVLSAKNLVDAPFAAINADDYYGAEAFELIYNFLLNDASPEKHAMVGYMIENTLTENGYVARGVCKVDENNHLTEIIERTHIETRPNGAAFTEDGENYTFIPSGTYVSMNMWGFALEMMGEIENRFSGFLDENLPKNPLKCEYFLPLVPNALLHEGKADIMVLPTT
ncbi:NTP transferase domain-containing protein, partial [Clostridiaceae bacterium OttesenSCG-928-D20]|nr:NTP transferase domain-containing protein [Clostridiaceae bacterium OttesenSCG-928-D20]